MTVRAFIRAHRQRIDDHIRNALNFVPRTASCRCPRNGTDHYHEDATPLNDAERRLWILNDEGLYNWARSEGVKV